ncbi:MAG TPA: hypothetical protein VL003_05345 [Pusillimonas sp.]|uniref:hypothetical protein n=1 Tax=Pusillimonas sp. TaxID=3040095 RepID=UPI002D119CE0|nr:hypothetical protein [Pusillimonas sp.]HUH87461.1 hypothetical protein [Pusillimonas sp.]
MLKHRCGRWVGFLTLAVLLAGCAGTRSLDQKSATAMLETSDYQAFAAQYLDAKGNPKYDPASLLDSLEAGKAFNDAGMWELSQQAFEAAGKLLSWKEDTVDTPEEVANLLGTTLTSDAFGAYQGKIHQGSLVDYYQAINHLMLGREADARVDFNRLQVRQRNAQTQLSVYAKSIDSSVKGGLDDEDSIGAKQSLGEVGPKVADGIKDLPSGLSQSKIRLATGDVLGAVFRSTSSATADKRSNLSRDMLRQAREASATRGGNAMIAYLERELRNKRGMLKNKVIVIYEDGVGPSFNEFRIDLPLFLVTDKVTYTGIALPQFVPGKPAFGSLSLGEGKTASQTATLTDLNALAGLEFDVAYKGIVAKAVVSTIVKTAAQAVINDQIDQQASPLFGTLLKLGTGAAQAALTQADTRAWINLPNTIQMAVIERPRDGVLNLSSPDGKPLGKLPISKDVNTLLLVKASGASGMPVIYQQELPAETPVPPLTVPAAVTATPEAKNEKA